MGNQADIDPDLLHAPGCCVCCPRSPPRRGGGGGYGAELCFSPDTRFAQGGELAASPAAPEELQEARLMQISTRHPFIPAKELDQYQLVLLFFFFFPLGTVSCVSSLCRACFFGYRAVESFQFP